MFLRNCGQDLKAALIQNALALIYTPCNEHFGIVPIEAMALSRAVIAHDSGGPRESVVSGETGFLCANWEEFGDAMGKLAEDRKLGEKMGEKGRERAEKRFSFEAFGEQLDREVKTMEKKSCVHLYLPFVIFALFLAMIRWSVCWKWELEGWKKGKGVVNENGWMRGRFDEWNGWLDGN